MEIGSTLLKFALYGAEWVLWLLIILSVLSVAVIIERAWFLATHRASQAQLARDMRELLAIAGAGEILGTSSFSVTPCLRGESPPSGAISGAMAGAKAREKHRLERNLAFLGTLGSNAPFIGLFGTVIGIIKAFHDLAKNQAGGVTVVMAGISEALVATAVGLLVAIPAVVAFNYFNRRVRTKMTEVDWMAHLALAELEAESTSSPSAPRPEVA